MKRWKTPEELKERYPMISDHMLHSIVAYRDLGCREGSFGEALLSNSLMGAFNYADIYNQKAMFQWVCLLHNDMPFGSHGSKKIYEAWCKEGGITGKNKQEGE